LGQTFDGSPTRGGENLLFVHGSGSLLSVDNNFGAISGSRIANGAVSIQNYGALVLDSSVLLVSGKDGLDPSSLFVRIEDEIGVVDLVRTSETLAVVSNGSLTITDNDMIGISALIIGQTPDAGPTQEAHVLVENGTITVINDPTLPKIPLGEFESEFGIPVVSNIGTGSLTIADSGVVEFRNGDFVIGVGVNDDAHVTVVAGGQLTAERVVIGLADFEGEPGMGISAAETGELILDDGIVNGDVIVDNNGALRGIGTVNGTIFVDGGTVAPGFSGGTLTAKGFILGPDSELVLEVILNSNGTVNTRASDLIVVTDTDTLDFSGGTVTIELYPPNPDADNAEEALLEILSTGIFVSLSDLFELPEEEEVVIFTYELTAPLLPILTPEQLDDSVQVVNFGKNDCKKGGWESLFRFDGNSFEDQGDCITYLNTGQ